MATASFADLGVPQSICDALAARDITTPFDIQAATLVDGLAGRDVLGRAPTGSGKTIAFGIPIVADLPKARPHHPTALILSPTRELADQIQTELASFAKPVRVGVVYGGVGYGKQVRALQQGVDVLVACPGRLEDLIERGDVSLSEVERVVLDEADRMADMGFVPAVRRILDQTSDQRQTVLFSATLDGDVAVLTRDYQDNPVTHEVGESTPDITLADHLFWQLDQPDRTQVAALVVGAEWPAIVFCRTRHGCDRLTKQLGKLGVDAVAIHGGRSQNQRTRALDAFATSRAQALIATDVAARGIHVDGVRLVLHFDPPEDHKTYVHRSGRTARAGAGGVVVSFITPEQTREARGVMRKIGLDEPVTAPDISILEAVAAGGSTPSTTDPRAIADRGPNRQSKGKARSGGKTTSSRRGSGHSSKNSRPKKQGHKPRGQQKQASGKKQGASNKPGGNKQGGNKQASGKKHGASGNKQGGNKNGASGRKQGSGSTQGSGQKRNGNQKRTSNQQASGQKQRGNRSRRGVSQTRRSD